MKILFTLTIALYFINPVNSQTIRFPAEVEAVLQHSGKNRAELEKAIDYFRKSGESLKLKAIYFLIANMEIHYSMNIYWADSLNHPVAFDELAYPSFEASLEAFEVLKKKTPGIHPVSFKYNDIDSIKGDFLIANIERAFEAWKRPWARQFSFDEFCEYILPYRVSSEPVQDWGSVYERKFDQLTDGLEEQNTNTAYKTLYQNIRTWFLVTNPHESRKEPLPLLGALQLVHRKQGPCEDLATLGALALRSQGICSGVDIATFWATSSGRHLWNYYFTAPAKETPFDMAQPNPETFQIKREPAKIIRMTYAKQPSCLASQLPKTEIPEGFMQLENYLDVTDHYWPVKDIVCQLFPLKRKVSVVYLCIFNFGQWKPAYWGWVTNWKVSFPKMPQGVAYLPMYYVEGKLLPAGFPVALGYQHENLLKADTGNSHSVILKEQENYLLYRPGKKYSLYFWNNQWTFLQTKVPIGNAHELVFDQVPGDALLLLVPEYSQHKERPFMITREGERIWW